MELGLVNGQGVGKAIPLRLRQLGDLSWGARTHKRIRLDGNLIALDVKAVILSGKIERCPTCGGRKDIRDRKRTKDRICYSCGYHGNPNYFEQKVESLAA